MLTKDTVNICAMRKMPHTISKREGHSKLLKYQGLMVGPKL